MMEAALARGMDQPDAWNATSVEWVRTAKVFKSLVFTTTFHLRAQHLLGTLSPLSVTDVHQCCSDPRDVSQQPTHI